MQDADGSRAPQFYFSLPRLIAKLCGRSAECTEQNGLEAHILGAAIHLIALLFAAHLLLANLPAWKQLLLIVPLALFVWISWSIFFYLSSLLLKLLRMFGVGRNVPQPRAQGVIVGIVITAFAVQLCRAGGWLGVIGIVWIVAVALNLLAALILALSHGNRPAPE